MRAWWKDQRSVQSYTHLGVVTVTKNKVCNSKFTYSLIKFKQAEIICDYSFSKKCMVLKCTSAKQNSTTLPCVQIMW